MGVKTKKTPYRKIKKAEFAWLEQVYLEIDSLKTEIAELKKTITFINEMLLKLNEQMKNEMKNDAS